MIQHPTPHSENEKLVQFIVRMPEELHERLMAQAQREERFASTVVRRALRTYLDTAEDQT